MKDHFPLPQHAVYENFKKTVSTRMRAKELKGLESEINEWLRFVVKKKCWTLSLFRNLKLLSMTALASQEKVFGCFLPEAHALYLEHLFKVNQTCDCIWTSKKSSVYISLFPVDLSQIL